MTTRELHPSGWTVLGIPIDSVGAPDGGPPFGTELAPEALRAQRIVHRLGADDAGDLDVRITGSARDPESGLVGGATVAPVVAAVRGEVARLLRDGRRPLLLGGCCTLLAGAFPGAVDALGPLGLVYADGHLDIYDHRTSPTGEVADMPVALLLGRGEPGILAAAGPTPSLTVDRLTVLGARDEDERRDVGALAVELGVVDVGVAEIVADPHAVGLRTARRQDGGFWLSLDVDVLGEDEFPATDYLMPGGLSLDQLRDLLAPIGQDRRLVGASVACYNPTKDPTGEHGAALVDLLVDVLGGAG
jgi:arginase